MDRKSCRFIPRLVQGVSRLFSVSLVQPSSLYSNCCFAAVHICSSRRRSCSERLRVTLGLGLLLRRGIDLLHAAVSSKPPDNRDCPRPLCDGLLASGVRRDARHVVGRCPRRHPWALGPKPKSTLKTRIRNSRSLDSRPLTHTLSLSQLTACDFPHRKARERALLSCTQTPRSNLP